LVGFINILEACRQNKIKHLIYASSSSYQKLGTILTTNMTAIDAINILVLVNQMKIKL
jgi:nucleoside-diphosphate-sugar epimerase